MPTEPLLTVDDVVVQFGGVTAVNHASFVAEAGRVTGLIGPNGAGKTTCFNVISGLQRPTHGKVRFNGRNVSHTPVHRRAKRGMGRTFQRLEAFGSLTVRDNVRVAHDIHGGLLGLVRPSRGDVDGLLERVGIAAYADERADSIPTGVGPAARAGPLPGGRPASCCSSTSRRRARTRPRPRSFGELLRDLASEGRGILMVEHDMDLVMSVCDVIHVLDFGSVIASGAPGRGPQRPSGAEGLPRLRRRVGRGRRDPDRPPAGRGDHDDPGGVVHERPDPRGVRRARRLRPHRGAARRRPVRAQGRGDGAARPQRRRQVHAHQDHQRPEEGDVRRRPPRRRQRARRQARGAGPGRPLHRSPRAGRCSRTSPSRRTSP